MVFFFQNMRNLEANVSHFDVCTKWLKLTKKIKLKFDPQNVADQRVYHSISKKRKQLKRGTWNISKHIIHWLLSFFRLLVVYQIQVVKKKVEVRQILKWVVPKIRRVPLTRISTKFQKAHIASQNRKSQVKKLEIDNKDNLITYLFTSSRTSV